MVKCYNPFDLGISDRTIRRLFEQLKWNYTGMLFDAIVLLTPIFIIQSFVGYLDHSRRLYWQISLFAAIGLLLAGYLILLWAQSSKKPSVTLLTIVEAIFVLGFGSIAVRASLTLCTWNDSAQSDSGNSPYAYYTGWVSAFRMSAVISSLSEPKQRVFWLVLISVAIGIICYTQHRSEVIFADIIEVIYIQLFSVYMSEKRKKTHIREKEYLTQESESLKSVIQDLLQGIVALDLEEAREVFSNHTFSVLCDLVGVKDCLDLFEKIQIKNFHISTTGCMYEEKREFHKKIGLIDNSNMEKITLKDYYLRIKAHPKSLENISGNKFGKLPLISFRVKIKMSKQTPGAMGLGYNVSVFVRPSKRKPILIIVFTDTSEREQLDIATKASENKTRLLASVSHELRTPLNGSINFIERALEDTGVPEEVKTQLLTPAIRSNRLLLSIINDILDFSQMQANKLRLFFTKADIRQTLKNCIELIEIQAQKKGLNLIMETDIPEDSAFFYTDHNRVAQIVINLLSNAIKFTMEGSITLKAEIVGSPGGSLFLGSKEVEISVTDTGIGMSPEDQKKLFQEFTKIDLKQQAFLNSSGVGLGLVISNNLAKRLGKTLGTQPAIKVVSEPNKGSTFSIIITDRTGLWFSNSNRVRVDSESGGLIELRNEFSSPREMSSSQDLAERGTLLDIDMDHIEPGVRARTFFEKTGLKKCICPPVLVVDDDMFNISAFENLAQKIGFKCDQAFNGKAAIQKVLLRCQRKCGGNCQPYAVIFMDCTMPVMDGFDASKILTDKMASGEIPYMTIVACTALETDSIKKKAELSGMKVFCLKPLSKDRVQMIVEKYL